MDETLAALNRLPASLITDCHQVMEDSKRRRRLAHRLLIGWMVAAGAMPAVADERANEVSTIPKRPFQAIHEPVDGEVVDGEAGHGNPVAEPSAQTDVAAFLPIREPQTQKWVITEPLAKATTAPPAQPITKPTAQRRAVPTAETPASLARTPATAVSAMQSLPPLPGTEVAASVAAVDVYPETAEESRWQRKISLARQVSSEILGSPVSAQSAAPSPNVSTITSRRLAQQAADRLAEARRQLQRGTLLSAQGSAYEALRLIADANDLLVGDVASATALQQARTALRESEDFAGRFGPVGPKAIERMAASHQTSILKNCDTSHLNGSRATDIYLDFARGKLAAVAEANPIAIEALTVLAQAERQTESPGPLTDAMVISLLRAAIQAGPNDPVVANELGFQLLNQGLLEEAQWALEHSYRLQPTRSAGVNLAETLRQRGDLISARVMFAKLNSIPAAPAPQPQVYTISPQQFAALSQRTAPPRSGFAGGGSGFAGGEGSPAPSVAQPIPVGQTAMPTPAAPIQPAEPRGPVGRVADAVSQLWK